MQIPEEQYGSNAFRRSGLYYSRLCMIRRCHTTYRHLQILVAIHLKSSPFHVHIEVIEITWCMYNIRVAERKPWKRIRQTEIRRMNKRRQKQKRYFWNKNLDYNFEERGVLLLGSRRTQIIEVSGGIGYFDMPWRAVKWGVSSEKELVLLSFG